MAHCDSVTTSERQGRGPIRLPVLDAGASAAKIRRSRNGARRAAVLVAVHLIIAAHVAWWLTTGSALTPIEPSESMQTLELGLINAGFIFFTLAILSTLIFGRFVCGWACHIVALQDLCGWIMKKCGVRPHPFRSRLLMFFPLCLALYMFVWPTFKRVVAPALEGWWPTVRSDLGIAPLPPEGFVLHLMTEDFWSTFAPPLVAIPFLLVCGFATVYFLGAKGFCTYGCPYGGFFAPADRLSPGRIVVDHDKCHQCGHCTAVCTSNVRVHDEVREYGMVVDPGCMKCMDCVSVCPNDALAFSFARPSVAKGAPRNARPKRVLDTTLGEDLGLAVVFLAIFLGTRGAYGVIPMLMAVGLAGCGTFLAWKCWKMTRVANVRFSVFQLKRNGRLTRAGWVMALLTALCAGLTAHTGVVNYHRWRGDTIYDRLSLDKHALLAPDAPPLTEEALSAARAGLEHFRIADSWRNGGIGLASMSSSELRAALLALAVRDFEAAEANLRHVWTRFGPGDEMLADLGRVIIARSNGADAGSAAALYERVLEEHPEFWGVRDALAGLLISAGRIDEAIAEAQGALPRIPPTKWTATAHARTLLTLGRMQAMAGKPEEGLANLRRAAEVRPTDAVVRENLAVAILQIEGNLDGAIAQAYEALKLAPGNHNLRFQLGGLEMQRGRIDEAIAIFDELERRDPGVAARRQVIAGALREAGRDEEARRFDDPPAPAAK